MSEHEQIENLKAALDMARTVIGNYEAEIRGAADLIGVDLVEKGFCQGRVYKNALAMIDRIEKGELKP